MYIDFESSYEEKMINYLRQIEGDEITELIGREFEDVRDDMVAFYDEHQRFPNPLGMTRWLAVMIFVANYYEDHDLINHIANRVCSSHVSHNL